MMRLPLTIRYRPRPLREAVAWFVPGSDPREWLAELTAWGTALREIAIRPIPVAQHDSTPCGVLVTTAAGEQPRVSGRCQGYGRVGERLFLPVNAALEPEVLDSELADLLPEYEGEHVFHPVAGLVRVDTSKILRIADLLQPPRLIPTDWDLAQPGHAFSRRLVSVEPEQTPSVETVLEAGGDDIATKDPRTERLPRHPRDPRHGQGAGTESGRSFVARTLAGMWRGLRSALGLPARAGGAEVPPLRDEELDRLLRLLESDPDEGLRFALPLALPLSESAHRGIAPPPDRLTRQETDFDLNRLRGGEAAAPWYVPQDQFETLRQRYRELANREIRIGRHRRAAYIFGHLLGDMHAAASALATGGHWREAAIVYRDRLDQPLAAAECLERGGLWAEAIELYEKLQAFEKVGDLYCIIDHREEAEAAYRKAVAKHEAAGDLLEAARLLEVKLQLPEEALGRLAAGWPRSNQAGRCLEEMFRILGGLQRHEDAAALTERLVEESPSAIYAGKAVKVLADAANTYPDAEIRALAADKARVITGRLLATAPDAPAGELLQAIRLLDQRDRLLRRDCRRFEETRAARRPREPARPGRRHGRLALVWKFHLPWSADWHSAVSTPAAYYKAYYVAGYEQERLTVLRCSWEGDIRAPDAVHWKVSPAFVGAPILLCPDPWEHAGLLVHMVGASPLSAEASFRVTDQFPNAEPVGPHREFSQQTLGVARSADGLTWLVEQQDDQLLLSTYGSGAQMMSAPLVPRAGELAPGDPHSPRAVPMCARSTHVFVGLGDRLLCLKRGVRAETVAMPGAILSLVSPPGDSGCLLATCEHGAAVLWYDTPDSRIEMISDELSGPVGGFSGNGDLVLLGQRRVEVFRRSGRGFVQDATDVDGPASPMAVLTARQPDQVLLCSRDGEMQLRRVCSS